jgi:transcriptional regulator with XRE-family HTH domain
MPVYSSHLLQYEDLRLGDRMRGERQTAGLTLRQLADKVGISVARLSEIETGQHVPDVPQVLAVAAALGVPSAAFVPGDVRVPYQITRDMQCRAREPRQLSLRAGREERPKHHSVFWPLADLFIGRHLEPVLAHIMPAGSDPQLCSHHDEEFVFVVQGTIDFLIRTPQGICREELRRGDCVYFRSDLPDCLHAGSGQPGEVLHVFGSRSAPVETGFQALSTLQFPFHVDERDEGLRPRIGDRLQALREAHGWKLDQLAEAVGLSPRHLRQIEDGERDLAVDKALLLARALGRPLSELLTPTPGPGPYYFVQRSSEIAQIPGRTRRTPVERPFAPRSKTCRPLARGFPTRHMYPYLLSMLNLDIGTLNLHEHHGHEFLYVLDGELELTTYSEDGRVTETLRPGDACYLDSTVPHLVRGQSRNPYAKTSAEVIDVFWSPLGESYLFGD